MWYFDDLTMRIQLFKLLIFKIEILLLLPVVIFTRILTDENGFALIWFNLERFCFVFSIRAQEIGGDEI